MSGWSQKIQQQQPATPMMKLWTKMMIEPLNKFTNNGVLFQQRYFISSLIIIGSESFICIPEK